MSLIKINLGLLEQKFSALSDTPYFSSALRAHAKQLKRIAATAKASSEPEKILRSFEDYLWWAVLYLDGSAARLLPHEVVYGLECALKDWTTDDYVITTAILHQRSFSFRPVPPNFYQSAELIFNETFQHKLIQIALPELYRHRPLYNFALYHELGHFIDGYKNVIGVFHLQYPNFMLPGLSPNPAGWNNETVAFARNSHLGEYFSDLFAACYVGSGITDFLEKFTLNAGISPTHPATSERIKNVEAFLNGASTPLIDAFQAVLASLSMPPLKKRFTKPNISAALDNVAPFAIKNVEELHGVFGAGWEYLHNAKNTETWKSFEMEDIERIINDLVEKSIRSFIIKEKWRNGTP